MSRAEIVRGILSEWGITAVVINKKDTTIHMFNGQVEVMVQNEDVVKALKIVEDEIII
ncbi:MAG: DUF2007 domain-containing protein [Cyclobacteriaceae bacterium]|nr:DUF2007 domain-containing protein [Cyclobacteriaceae bacterium]